MSSQLIVILMWEWKGWGWRINAFPESDDSFMTAPVRLRTLFVSMTWILLYLPELILQVLG
jgi:hypothetical protein